MQSSIEEYGNVDKQMTDSDSLLCLDLFFTEIINKFRTGKEVPIQVSCLVKYGTTTQFVSEEMWLKAL